MFKKRITFVGFFPGYGGAEKSLITTANQLCASGYQVSIIALKENNFVYSIDPRITTYLVHDKSKVKLLTILWRLIHLFELLRKIKPHIVISFWLQPAYLSLLIKPFLGFEAVYSERGDPSDKEYKGLLGLFRNISFRMLDSIVFQTHAAQKYFSQNVREKSVVIYNPITVNKIIIFSQDEREKRIVNVGRLHPQKNQKLLIKAFGIVSKNFPEYVLEIYGEGELKKELLLYIQSLNLSKKVFILEPTSEIHSKIENASLFVLSSDYEGMPNALLEAMSLGIPSISVDWRPGAIHEFMKHGYNGLIVKSGDVNQLSETIDFALHNPYKMEIMAKHAREISKQYNLLRYTSEWDNFISKFISY